ncbi:glycosyl hydrolase [Nocardioides sp. MAHUQ-72]|uniref:glycosyl hydrolase n=1 Tax=unclassified Nocardioides TaxID=2615069 RepID=UPI003612A4AB
MATTAFASGSFASTADQSAATKSTATATTDDTKTKFGGTIYENAGESYEQAYQRVTNAYGGSLDAIRYFFPGLPSSWSKLNQKVHNTPLVVSFRADPAAVLAGKYDAQLKQWFADAPTDHRTNWSYWHEPENDSVDKAKYKAAWQHIDKLANAANNPRLKSTLILMCWSLNPHSGRNWQDWYPGDSTIDVLGFDCYNTGRKSGVYRDPQNILQPAADAAAKVGKPWGIAEFGSTVIGSDGGEQGRATWLKGMANYARNNGATFATYFDSYVGFDYRLHDTTSKTAWKDVVQNY